MKGNRSQGVRPSISFMPGESCSARFTQSLAICHLSQPGHTGPCVLQNASKKFDHFGSQGLGADGAVRPAKSVQKG